MRVLFSQNMIYLPTFVGASKSNRILLEALAARGHECEAVVIACRGDERHTAFYEEMKQRGIEVVIRPDYDTFDFYDVHPIISKYISRRNRSIPAGLRNNRGGSRLQAT